MGDDRRDHAIRIPKNHIPFLVNWGDLFHTGLPGRGEKKPGGERQPGSENTERGKELTRKNKTEKGRRNCL